MKNKGFVQFLVILLAIVCLYQLSFTLVTRNVEKGVKEDVIAIVGSDTVPAYARVYKQHIDSIQNEKVYPLFGYTYQDCKQREINLGLDLQGGMNVTLEISTQSMVKGLGGEDEDAQFNQALERAEAAYKGQGSFVDYFAKEYEAINPEKGLARIFYRKNRKAELPNQYNSSNEEIYDWLKKEEIAKVGETYEVIRTRIDQFNVTQPNVQRLDNGRILVELPGVDDADRVIQLLQSSAQLEFWEVYNNDEVYKYFEDARSIISDKLKAQQEKDSTKVEEVVEADEFANTEGLKVEGDTVIDEFAGLKESKDSTDTLSTDSVAQKELSREEQLIEYPLMSRMALPQDESGNVMIRSFIGFVKSTEVPFFEEQFKDPDVRAQFPDDLVFKWSFDETEDGFVTLYALRGVNGKSPVLDGDVIDNARPTINPNGAYEVTMLMNNTAAKEWSIITEQASSKANKEAIAIVLDNKVYSAPTVQGKIPNGSSSISGNFEMEDAEDLSNILKAGRLSVPTRVVEQTVVGPTLGAKAINAGLVSLAIGFLAVILFMMFYYGKAGIYAVIALLANLFFILGVLSGYGAALTLPGMAGLVLTIGMAVDANVLIFERIKEELGSGKGFKAAVRHGYKAALTSIIDANVTTLIAAIILMTLGKGPVAGFGIILLIGILSSLFTSILLTRLFVERDIAKGNEIAFNTSGSKNMLRKFNFNFIGNRKKFYLVSGLIILAGIGSMVSRGVNTGVDFKGGWSYVMDINGAENTEDIQSAIKPEIENTDVEVKTYGTEGYYKVTTSYRIADKDSLVGQEVKAAIIKGLSKYGVTDNSVMSESKVGPTIAEDIKRDSTLAIILSLIGMFIYIVGRFRKWGYGLGATVALFHDVLIVFSLYSILPMIVNFSMDVDQAFIAAILTVVGYSINDTVVVFDRVREFLGLHKYEKNTSGIINDAINQTLSRTLVTSLTTLLVVIILFLFGGEGLKGFTFALLIGVAVGTYSSICIATPIVVDFMQKKEQ
ncbi:MAG: protein translocase subunit SecDF [Bacteroidetes bacterium]|jgi:SecD/SecF fusion protein|nr:protein translocase subunit SecDF [Bacteroidota bacterium]